MSATRKATNRHATIVFFYYTYLYVMIITKAFHVNHEEGNQQTCTFITFIITTMIGILLKNAPS